MVEWQSTNKPDVARNVASCNLSPFFVSTHTDDGMNANLVFAFGGADGTQGTRKDCGLNLATYTAVIQPFSTLRNANSAETTSLAREIQKYEPKSVSIMEMNAHAAEKENDCSCILITSTMMVITCESMLTPPLASVCIDGLSPRDSQHRFNCFAQIATWAKLETVEFVLTGKVQRLAGNGVAPSGAKCTAPQAGDEIVCSAWQHAAVAESDGQELANLAEHKGSSTMSLATAR